MATEMPDHAYGHCLAVLRNPAAAESAASRAMVKGGISRTSVLSQARFAALEASRHQESDGRAAPPLVPNDITELAWMLTETRPAVERAVIDLDGRHQLDRARVGRTLGLPAAAAAARVAEVAAAWAEHLDPALLAHLGPGECPGLEAVLEEAGLYRPAPGGGDEAAVDPPALRPSARLDDLLAVVPAVHAHTAGCERCHDRVRAMVTTRALVSHTPLEQAPGAVREAARRARFRRPALLPPPLDGTGQRRASRAVVMSAAIVILLLITGGAVVVDRHAHQNNRSQRVAALTASPRGGNALVATPAVLHSVSQSIALKNTSDHPIAWHARPDAPWLGVSPPGGRLPAGGSAVVTAHVLDGAPSGKPAALVTVSGDDGSTAAVQLQAATDRPPDVAVSASGCTITAEIVDPLGVASVSLHWMFEAVPGTSSTDMEAPMAATKGATTYTASLPSHPGGVIWWVTATDSRGIQARTSNAALADAAAVGSASAATSC